MVVYPVYRCSEQRENILVMSRGPRMLDPPYGKSRRIPTSWDVVVIGAGPAGSMTAFWLAKHGVKVLLIDRAAFPRWKTCGGGITAHAAQALPFDFSPVVQTELAGIRFSFNLAHPFTRHANRPLVYGVQRSRFDAFLAQQAMNAGVTFADRLSIRGYSLTTSSVRVQTDHDMISTKILVGADGANSLVSRRLNGREAFVNQLGLVCEIPHHWLPGEQPRPPLVRVDAGTLAHSYGWVFPKGDMANIGVGGSASSNMELRTYLFQYLKAHGIHDKTHSHDLSLRGHKLPTLTPTAKLASNRILLVGDAAGLVEPFTGDGISNAIRSASIAAETILDALSSGAMELAHYEKRVREEIGSDLVHAWNLARCFHRFPELFHYRLRHQDGLWKTFCDVLCGTKSFRQLRCHVLGRLSFLWPLIDLWCRRPHPQAAR